MDLVHMNGRVYDAKIGRFISADPFIQSPLMSQSFNRYSYVMNDPLSLVDPSGYSWLSKQFKKAKKHLRAITRFHLKPTPRNFFETIRQSPNQDKIDRYIMTHEWAYKLGYAAAVVSSWWIGGYGGAVYLSEIFSFEAYPLTPIARDLELHRRRKLIKLFTRNSHETHQTRNTVTCF